MYEIPFKDDIRDGVQKFYSKGKLYQESSFKNGKQDGEEKWYREDGSLHFSIIYENDEIKSGKCGDGRTIGSKTMREYEEIPWFRTLELYCEKQG